MSAPQDISQNKALLWFMAAACGLCAGANYYSQPLIHSIQQYFAVTESKAALTVTFAQVSYALGLLFIVPMGDVVNKTKFIPLLMTLCAMGLFLSAFSVNLPMLWVGTVLVGLFSVAVQVLIPLATMTVQPEKTGEVVGFALIQLALALVHTSNQSIIFCLRPDAKSRINATYMTAYFTGGACGSALGIFAWNHGGWTMTCLAGLCLVLGCMLFSLLDNL